MDRYRIQDLAPSSSVRVQISETSVPAGFALVPAQVFQSLGSPANAWQRNLYLAAYEQARQSVQQNRQRLFRLSQNVALN
jgi:hypothetical protein